MRCLVALLVEAAAGSKILTLVAPNRLGACPGEAGQESLTGHLALPSQEVAVPLPWVAAGDQAGGSPSLAVRCMQTGAAPPQHH